MGAVTLLVELRKRQIGVRAMGAGLQIWDRHKRMTPALRQAVKAQKPDLHALLSDPDVATTLAPGSAVFDGERGVIVILPPDPPWADPHDDLEADHAAWDGLLESAYWIDGPQGGPVWGLLHSLRCFGASLSQGGDGTWRLEPGEISGVEWAALKITYLLPEPETISRLLGALSEA